MKLYTSVDFMKVLFICKGNLGKSQMVEARYVAIRDQIYGKSKGL